MSDRRYYFAAEQRYNTSGDNDELLYPFNGADNANDDDGEQGANDRDADKDDDSEFLQDVPYSSSSIDRSSIGSIPWADDAIKKNKLDWERVERMLSGEEALPEQEPELRHEIADWQRKFPSLVGCKAKPLKQQSFDSSHHTTMPDDSGDIDSMSNLSLNSLEDDFGDDDDDDGFLTPTAERLRQRQPEFKYQQQDLPTRKYLRPTQNLVEILDKDLRITSVKLRKREPQLAPSAAPTPQQQQKNTHSATAPRSRLRMPPILNVLDSNRRFRGLLNNRSFVQLTQVQQQQKRQSNQGNHSAWHMPVAAAAFSSRFLNNKHAIVLPALNRHRDGFAMAATTTVTSSQSNSSGGGAHNSNSSSLGSGMVAGRRPMAYNHQLARGTTNSSNTPSTGRSISAAVHHPRTEYTSSAAFYVPYSASKFKAFK